MVWVVVNTENDTPRVFTEDFLAREYMMDMLLYHKNKWRYDNEDYLECMSELEDSYETREEEAHFGTYLGELSISAYHVSIGDNYKKGDF